MANDDWAIEAMFPPVGFMTHEQGDMEVQQLIKEAFIED